MTDRSLNQPHQSQRQHQYHRQDSHQHHSPQQTHLLQQQRHLPYPQPEPQPHPQRHRPYVKRQTSASSLSSAGGGASGTAAGRRRSSLGGAVFESSTGRDGSASGHNRFYSPSSRYGGTDANNIDPSLEYGTGRHSLGVVGSTMLSESPIEHPDEDSASDSGVSRSPSPGAEGISGTLDRKKRERACDSCRGLKVKCLRENGDPTSTCKRCAKAKRRCITTPSTRKRRVTKSEPKMVALLESRVQELERTIQSLRTQDGHGRYHTITSPSSFETSPTTPGGISGPRDQRGSKGSADLHGDLSNPQLRAVDATSKKRKLEGGISNATRAANGPARDDEESVEIKHIPPHALPPKFDHSDIPPQVDTLVERSKSDEVFKRFVDKFLPVFPAVPFSTETTVDSVRTAKPILFLAILACNCQGIVGPVKQQKLLDLLRDTYADCQWRKGEKTVELIQAYHITTMCYRPPAHFSQSNFYQLAVLALVMGIDLGLGRRMDPQVGSLTQKMHDQVNTGDARRAWLVSYYLCTSISMMLRRPLLIRFGRYEDECMRILSEGPDAIPSDRMLVQHVKFAHLTEETFTEFNFHDSKAGATMEDQRVVGAVKLYNEKLDHILDNIPDDLDPTLLQYSACSARINIHEVSLHQSKNQEIFWPPLFDVGVKQDREETKIFNSDQVTSMLTCMTAAHKMLDLYIGMPHDRQQNMPAFFIKLYRASKHSQEIQRYMRPEGLQLDRYLSDIEAIFARMVAADPGCHHSKFIMVVRRLRGHYEGLRDGSSKKNRSCQNNIESDDTTPKKNQESGSAQQVRPQSQQQERQQQQQYYSPPSASASVSSNPQTASSPLHVLSEIATGVSAAANSSGTNPLVPMTSTSAQYNLGIQNFSYMPPPAPQHQLNQLQTPHQLTAAPATQNWYMPGNPSSAQTDVLMTDNSNNGAGSGQIWGSTTASGGGSGDGTGSMQLDPALMGMDGFGFGDGVGGGANVGPDMLWAVPGLEFYGFDGLGL